MSRVSGHGVLTPSRVDHGGVTSSSLGTSYRLLLFCSKSIASLHQVGGYRQTAVHVAERQLPTGVARLRRILQEQHGDSALLCQYPRWSPSWRCVVRGHRLRESVARRLVIREDLVRQLGRARPMSKKFFFRESPNRPRYRCCGRPFSTLVPRLNIGMAYGVHSERGCVTYFSPVLARTCHALHQQGFYISRR